MSEVFCKFNDVLSDNQIAELYRRCNYDKDDKELYFTSNDFINGYSLIEYGDNDYEFGEQFTNIINKNGDFVEIKLNKDIQYANGKIIKLNDSDNGTYFFKVHRILELDYKYEPLKGYVVKKQRETSFFYIKVTRYPIKADENAVDLNFVINPELKVIASFSDDNAWGIKYDGYNNCNVYTERNFFFINEERKFLVFTQKLIANSDETGFFDEHMYGLEPELYDAFMRENDPNWGYEYGLSESIYEEELDEETLDKAIKKYEGIIDENDEEEDDDDIPYLGDINFFFEDKNNKLYKDAFSDYYRTLYGIIDCYTKSSQQLTPFTDCLDYVINIIWERWRCEKEIKEHGHYNFYSQGWDFDHTRFYGYVMDNKFFDYPSIVKGFTLKYVLKYYPSILKWLVEHNIIIIPNKLLNNLGDNELTRYIRLKQETCLEYSSISSIDDTIRSNEKYGIISTYQDKTLRQIIYSKGGTKHLINLIKHSNLEIEKDVIEQLINESNNQLETKCYNIILDVIEDIEYQEEYNAWVQQQIHDDYVRECNKEFNNMMNDFDAWGNID